MLSEADRSEILASIEATQSWCRNRLDLDSLANSLRSLELKPSSEFWDLAESEERKAAIVSRLVDNRSRLLARRSAHIPSRMSGRLLCYYQEVSLGDGFAGAASAGYLDPDEVPPWDTWVFYSRVDFERHHRDKYSTLYSWVPEELVEFVDRAIREDSVECLVWGEKLEALLR